MMKFLPILCRFPTERLSVKLLTKILQKSTGGRQYFHLLLARLENVSISMGLFFVQGLNTFTRSVRNRVKGNTIICVYWFGILCLMVSPKIGTAQLNMGIHVGGNLGSLKGDAFRSSKKIGAQGGIFLSYHFNKYLGVQVEPGFNLNRVRANRSTIEHPHGIQKGNKRLYFFNMPMYLKISILPGVALLGGPEINKLINDQKYRLNDGQAAFKPGYRLGYGLGLELGKIYFRYKVNSRVSKVVGDWNAPIEQFQLGLRFSFL